MEFPACLDNGINRQGLINMQTRYYSDAPPVNFDAMPELTGYTNEPDAMYIGCPGKHGYLKLDFELDRDGKSILRNLNRRAPLIVQQALYFDSEMPSMPCVYILSSGGPNVDGDRYVQEFHLKKDSMAFISTGAYTKIAEMKHNYSGMKQNFALEAGSYLEYLPEPVIPSRHARYISDTTITIDPTAALLYSETFMAGRKYYKDGEVFKYDVVSICSHAERPNGKPLFRDKFVIQPNKENIREIGIMADYDVFASVLALMPEDKIENIYNSFEPFINKKLAAGITRLPNQAGLMVRMLGLEPGPVKKLIRQFGSMFRQAIKGHPLPEEFPWR